MMRRLSTKLCAAAMSLTAAVGTACGSAERPEDVHELDVEQVAAGTTEFQRALLADGEVTFAEYEKATLAAINCLQQAGLVVEGPHPRGGHDDRFLDYNYGFDDIPPDQLDAMNERMLAVGDACEREYRLDVARVWEHQPLLAPARREQPREVVIGCLRAAGTGLAGAASVEEVHRVSARPGDPAVRRCRESYPDFYVVDVH